MRVKVFYLGCMEMEKVFRKFIPRMMGHEISKMLKETSWNMVSVRGYSSTPMIFSGVTQL